MSAMQSQVEAFDEIYANICGRADNYNAVVNTTAGNFSELIADDLLGVAEENRTAWNCALSASFHAVGVLNLYIAAVEHYEDRIETLESELDTEISAAETDKEKQDLSDEYKDLADGEWETLKGAAGQASDMLSEGPTPENVRTLTENGYLGDVPGGLGWVVTGNVIYFSLPEGMSGREFSEAAREAAEGAPDPTGERARNAALLAAFMSSLALREETMTDREREVLEEFNGSLEGSGGNPSGIHGDYVNIMRQISENNFLSYGEKRDLMNALGTSIMVTSDESKGGGFSDLPQSVRHLISGPEIYGPGTGEWGSNWEEDFGILTRYLEFASESHMARTATENGPGEPLVGGDVFSATAIGTVAANLDGADDEDVMARILRIASENEDANYAIITGSYPNGDSYDHPGYFNYGSGRTGTNNEELLGELFSHKWESEEGESSVTGVVDWIHEWNDGGSEEEKLMAGDAAFSLIEIMSGGGNDNPFQNTGIEVDGNENATVGEVNTHLADSFADMYLSYIDDFSITYDGDDIGYRELTEAGGDPLFHEIGDNALVLPDSLKRDFLHLIVSNEDVSPKAIGITEVQERRILNQVIDEGGVDYRGGGATAGSLREIVTEAIIDDYESRVDSVEEARDAAQRKFETGYGVFSAVVSGAAGAGGPAASIGADALLELMKAPYEDFVKEGIKQDIPDVYSAWDEEMRRNDDRPEDEKRSDRDDLFDFVKKEPQAAENQVVLDMAHVFLERGIVDVEKLQDEGLLVPGGGGDSRLPVTPAEWDTGSDMQASRLLAILREGYVESSGGSQQDVDDFMDAYVNNYNPRGLRD
ncbi:hypothetical protein ABZY32_16745 [Nocardiopsis alba]|uniref:TPR repeat region-containing protein n=2 Tax=Nocardiopsis alba TaxID=53437 RepID=UPI0012684C53|nr:hypothetical protein [Nocardiopsis alba]